jgi:hypothetical protein
MALLCATAGTKMPELKTQDVQVVNQLVGSRALLIATAAYLFLAVVGLIAVGTFPAATETGEQLVAWFREKGESVRLFVWAWTVAIPPLAIMIACLRRLLPAPHRDVFVIGAVSYLVAIEIGTWTWAGLALHADGQNPATTRTILDVAIFLGPVLTGSTTTMIGPVTLLGLLGQSRIPRWLGVLGLIAFLEQAVETITIFGSSGFTQPGGAMNMQLGASLTLGWLVAFGIWGGLRGRATTSSPESSST